jgi:hypothetical protein
MLFLCAFTLTGCSSVQSILPATSWHQNRVRNEGYSLLYKLLSQESDVAKILIIKDTDPPVTALIKEIANTSGEAQKQLEAFSKANHRLNLKMTDLPKVEQQTRDAIASTEAKQLLFSTGKTFESRLLFTQAEAMNYAAHLAKILEDQETDSQRKEFLAHLSDECTGLHDRVIKLLNAID